MKQQDSDYKTRNIGAS